VRFHFVVNETDAKAQKRSRQDTPPHIPVHYAYTKPRRSAQRNIYSWDGARSAISTGQSSWNLASLGFSLLVIIHTVY